MPSEPIETGPMPSECPRCGTIFVCGAVAGLERCWCMERPRLALAPTAGASCFCPRCLDELAAAGASSS